MAVTLTVSKTLAGPQVSDLLNGGTTGVDMGTVANNAVSATAHLLIRHDGVNKITSTAFYIQSFSGTPYGGAYTPAADLARLLALGDMTPTSYGLQLEEDWDAAVPFSTFYQVKTGAADSFANRRTIAASSMSYNNSGVEANPSAPAAGEIGPDGNTTVGDRGHLTYRMSIPATETDGGIRQFDLVVAYSYTN